MSLQKFTLKSPKEWETDPISAAKLDITKDPIVIDDNEERDWIATRYGHGIIKYRSLL